MWDSHSWGSGSFSDQRKKRMYDVWVLISHYTPTGHRSDSKCLVIAVNFFDLWTGRGAKISWTFGHFRAAPAEKGRDKNSRLYVISHDVELPSAKLLCLFDFRSLYFVYPEARKMTLNHLCHHKANRNAMLNFFLLIPPLILISISQPPDLSPALRSPWSWN